jgi:hypothetical protein
MGAQLMQFTMQTRAVTEVRQVVGRWREDCLAVVKKGSKKREELLRLLICLMLVVVVAVVVCG